MSDRGILTPPRLTSPLPPLENWLVSWYSMVCPRFLASLKWEVLFPLCILSSETVTQSQLSRKAVNFVVRWWYMRKKKKTVPSNSISEVFLWCSYTTKTQKHKLHYPKTLIQIHVAKTRAYFPWHWYLWQTVFRFHLKTHCGLNQTPNWKQLSEFNEQLPAHTKLLCRMWQWWTRTHRENES